MAGDFTKIVDAAALLEAAPVVVEAVKGDFAGLAKRVEVLDVKEFRATFKGLPEGAGIIRLDGSIRAALSQECVRTLEPVETHLKDSFSLLLMEADVAEKFLAEQEEEALEDIEIIEDGKVDLGEIAAQYLSLAIDRFPVKEGAELETPASAKVNVVSEAEDKGQKNPFAVLKNLNKKG